MSTPFGADERVARASCGATTSALVSTRGRAAVWGQVVEVNHDVCGMAKVTQPQLFNPLRSKFVSYIATYAEVCFAVIRVPGVDDVTEGFFTFFFLFFSFVVILLKLLIL